VPLIYVSQFVYDEIQRLGAAVQTSAEGVIVAALQQTGPEATARYYRERFYVIAGSIPTAATRSEPHAAGRSSSRRRPRS